MYQIADVSEDLDIEVELEVKQELYAVGVGEYSPDLEGLDLPTDSRYEDFSELPYEVNNQIETENKTSIKFIIPEDYDGSDLTINAQEAVMEAFSMQDYMPGQYVDCQVVIENCSPYDFAYTPGTFGFEAYDGIYESNGPSAGGEQESDLYYPMRTGKAISALMNGREATDENVDEALRDKGYENGIADLYKYYIDFYNDVTGNDVKALSEISVDDFCKKMVGNSQTYTTIRETDPYISRLFTDMFYHKYMGISTEPGFGKIGNSLYSFAVNENDAFETDAQNCFGILKAGTESEPLNFTLRLSTSINNLYADYSFGFNFGVKFTNTTPPAPTPDPTPGNSGGGSGSGGGGGNPDGPGADRTPEGGPGVVINEPEVPLAALPEIAEPVMIPEEEVPLAGLPKTGDRLANEITFLVSGLLLGLYGILGIRKKEDQ